MIKLLVVLDPGHYPNYNKGAVSGYYEGNKMYDLTTYERDALKAYGIDVIITRDRNKDKDLYSRGQVAVKNANGYDSVVFISNHSNAGGGTGAEAFRSAYLPGSEELGKKIVEAVVSTMNPVTGVTKNRGVKTCIGRNGDYYGVIRGAVSGAKSESQAKARPVQYVYIVEHGFHDNVKECAFLYKNENLKKIAEAKAKVIADYFGFTKVTTPETPTSTGVSFKVNISRSDLWIRKGPGTNYDKVKYIDPGTYTISEVKSGKGSSSGWGRLKSGVGWISLDYVTRV